MLPFLSPLRVRCSVKQYRKDFGQLGTPQPTSDVVYPLGDQVLKDLEEWFYRDQGDDFGDLTLGDQMLKHLEEWSCGDQGDYFGDLNGSEARTAPTMTPLPLPSDREHPLWDRELDG
jgi:hypothetical protein